MGRDFPDHDSQSPFARRGPGSRRLLVLSLVLVLVSAGCALRGDFEPAPGELAVPGTDAAISMSEGVRLAADPSRRVESPSGVLSIWLGIENFSGRGLLLTYPQILVVGDDGTNYVPLPPYVLDLSALEPVPGLPAAGPVVAGFPSDGFFVAPSQAGLWRGLTPWWRALPGALQSVEDWRGPPNRTIAIRSLPEGVLEHGGVVGGYVHFLVPELPADQVSVQLVLADADTGERFGEILLRFDVDPL